MSERSRREAVRKVHPAELNVGRVFDQVIHIQVGHTRLKDALAIEGQVATLCDRMNATIKHRQQPALDAEWSLTPDIVYLGG